METVEIFDTTLRDGEQSPGATLTAPEKIKVAEKLAELDVDVIEAGFPVASQEDFNAVKMVANKIEGPRIAALARAREKDIKRAWQAVKNAGRRRIHTFMSTSDIHLKEQFGMTKEEALQRSVEAVELAKEYCQDVEFSPMDATRTDKDYLFQVLEEVISAGADVINIPDTVGYAQPKEFGELIGSIRENVSNVEDVTISVHCHDDLGLAVANSLEAVRAGAMQIECTINGLGERAGNASLEEVVMNLYTRKKYFDAETNINHGSIYSASRLVSDLTNFDVQRNKAVVGENAFSHESGIHQQGLLTNKRTYEIMSPELIGKKTEFVIGKHSGRHAIEEVLSDLGFDLSEDQSREVTEKIKKLADKQKRLFDDDIIAIASEVSGRMNEREKPVELKNLEVKTEIDSKPEAKVDLLFKGERVKSEGVGVGSVDAVTNSIQKVIPAEIDLKNYNLKAVTKGTDALADVRIKVEDAQGNEHSAEAINEDVVIASAKAFIKGVNKALAETKGAEN